MPETAPFLLFMPSYNQAHYIVDAVRSVLAQDDPNWQLWIVDNSTDNTSTVMAEFADARIRFHHISSRMDPGSCLNWMLERAAGRDFSYIHTDNNLRASYVRRMREALADDPNALAYCDMRVIDDAGVPRSVYRRGAFDVPRLLSADTLGVPFAATTALAKQVGGFSVRDFADDVRFCVESLGIARYVYLPEALVDYRLHGGSRTEAAGGDEQMRKLFAALMPKVFVALEGRGLQPRTVLANAIRSGLAEFDLLIEDLWLRRLSRWLRPWWSGELRFEHFFAAGVIGAPGFTAPVAPPRRLWIRRSEAGPGIGIHKVLLMRWYLNSRSNRKALNRVAKKLRDMLVTWASASISQGDQGVVFRIKSLDFRTLWVARELEIAMKWTPRIDPSVAGIPKWLLWGRASGNEPLLDCCTEVSFVVRD